MSVPNFHSFTNVLHLDFLLTDLHFEASQNQKLNTVIKILC